VLAAGLSGTQFECAVTSGDTGQTADTGTASMSPAAPVTAFSIAANVVTFQAANTFVVGQEVSISGLSTTIGGQLDGLILTVLSSGLTGSQFQCTLPASLPNAPATVPLTADSGTALALPVAPITSFSISSNVVTFQGVNGFTAGTKIQISGLSSAAGTLLNGQTVTVLATGLSRSQFEGGFSSPDVPSTTDSGTAVPESPLQNPTFLLSGQ